METAEPTPFFDRSAILSRKSRRTGKLEIDGKWVHFQSLSDGELSDYDKALFKRDDESDKVQVDEEAEKTARARLLQLTVIDEAGNLLFSPADVPSLAELDSGFVLPVVDAVREHCGITDAVTRRKLRTASKKN